MAEVAAPVDANPAPMETVKQEIASQNDSAVVSEPASGPVEASNNKDNSEVVKIVSDEDQKMLYAVLQFLKKNNLGKTVDALKNETEKAGGT